MAAQKSPRMPLVTKTDAIDSGTAQSDKQAHAGADENLEHLHHGKLEFKSKKTEQKINGMIAKFLVASDGANANSMWQFMFDVADGWKLPHPGCFLECVEGENTGIQAFKDWFGSMLKDLKNQHKDHLKNHPPESAQPGCLALLRRRGATDEKQKPLTFLFEGDPGDTNDPNELMARDAVENYMKSMLSSKATGGNLGSKDDVPEPSNLEDLNRCYEKTLAASVQAFGQELTGRKAWVSIGDGSSSGIKEFLQKGLLDYWGLHDELGPHGEGRTPVVLAIRLVEQDAVLDKFFKDGKPLDDIKPNIEYNEDDDDALLPCVTHAIFVHEECLKWELLSKLRKLSTTITFVANGGDRLYRDLLSQAKFGKEFIVFDKTGGAAQKLAWDVQHPKLVAKPQAQLCGVDVDSSSLPSEQFHIIDPLKALEECRKILVEILSGCQDAEAAADVAAAFEEKKRIQYAWEHLSVFRHNGMSFHNLGRKLQFTVVFLAFLTTISSVASSGCGDLRTDYIGQFGDWEDRSATQLDKLCGLRDFNSGNVTIWSVVHSKVASYYVTLTIMLPLVGSIVLAVTHKLNPTTKFAHLESAATAIESEIYLYRTRVLRYYSKKSHGQSDEQENAETSRPHVFAKRIKGILDGALSGEMRYDFLSAPTKQEKTKYVQLYDSKEEYKKKTRCSCRTAADTQHHVKDPVKDDGLSELQPDTYIQVRLIPMLQKYNDQARFLGRCIKGTQVIVILTTAMISVLAANKQMDLRPTVPIVVAGNAALMSCSQYEHLQTRLVNVRKSIKELTKLHAWWHTLTGNEKSKHSTKERLAKTTEQQANAEISAWKKSSEKHDDQPKERERAAK